MSDRAGIIGGGILVVLCIALAIVGINFVAQAQPCQSLPTCNELSSSKTQVRRQATGRLLTSSRNAGGTRCTRCAPTNGSVIDQGRGFITLSVCLLATIAFFRLWDIRNITATKTPRSTLTMLLMITATWLSVIFVNAADISEGLDRHDFPHQADSIGIPIFSVAIIVLVVLPILLVVGWIAVGRAPLPASLWAWDEGHPRQSVFWSAAYGMAALLIVVSLLQTA